MNFCWNEGLVESSRRFDGYKTLMENLSGWSKKSQFYTKFFKSLIFTLQFETSHKFLYICNDKAQMHSSFIKQNILTNISIRHQKLNDSTNTTKTAQSFQSDSFSPFLFSFYNRRDRNTQKNERKNLNNVLRRFANTTRKLLRKKIKANSPPTKENEVEWLVWALNAFVVVVFLWPECA